jgi:hypothetical protein
MKTPINVTFDTNTYSNIANPQVGRLGEKLWPMTKACQRSAGWRGGTSSGTSARGGFARASERLHSRQRVYRTPSA